MANKLHSGKVGPWLRPTEQCLLLRFFQALFLPRLPDPPRSRLRFPILFFFLSTAPPSLLSPLSYSPSALLVPCFTGEGDGIKNDEAAAGKKSGSLRYRSPIFPRRHAYIVTCR